jgi:hypothetical protein
MPEESVQKDEGFMIALILKGFEGNKAVDFTVGSELRRRSELARYLWTFGYLRSGWHLSDDVSTIMLVYLSQSPVPWYAILKAEWRLVTRGIGLRRLWKVWRRSRAVVHARISQGPHVHCWFVGTDMKRRNGSGARQLMQRLFALADELQLPVLIETTMEQNEHVYTRFGFATYLRIQNPDMTTYCMKRLPAVRAENQ